MSKQSKEKWHNENPNGKANLSWTLADYLALDEEPPSCILAGGTEGAQMEGEDVEQWARTTIQFLSIFREEYPEKFENQYKEFLLDLEYLKSLDKITEEEYKKLANTEILNFGQK